MGGAGLCPSLSLCSDGVSVRQFEAPRWVERAADGTTVEVDDRSPSVGAGSGPASPAATAGPPLFRLPSQSRSVETPDCSGLTLN